MSITKNLIIFILFTTYINAKFTDVVLGGWNDLSEQQAKDLSENLSAGGENITVKEGKSQLVFGTNYVVVVSHETAGECLQGIHVGISSVNRKTEVLNQTIFNNIKPKLLEATPGLTPCTEEQTKIMLSAHLNDEEDNRSHLSEDSQSVDSLSVKLDLDEISSNSEDIGDMDEHKSQTVHGGWKDMNEDDIELIENKLLLTQSNLKIVSGKKQLVSGTNYMLKVTDFQDENPCVLSFNFTPWATTERLKVYNAPNSNLESMFDSMTPCSNEVHTTLLGQSNLQFKTRVFNKFQEIGQNKGSNNRIVI